MKIIINDQFKENIKRLVFLLAIRTIYMILGLQVLSIEVYSYSSTGGFDINLNYGKETLSMIIFLIVTFIFLRLKQDNHFNYFLNVLLYIIYYIPINVAFSINDRDYGFCVLTNLFYIFLMLAMNRNTIILKNKNYENRIINYTYVRLVCMFFSILLLTYKLTSSGFSFYLGFSTDMIYENRAEYVNNLSDSSLIYLFRLIVVHGTTFIAPFYLYLSLKNKKIIDTILALLCMLSRYSITYEKSIILLLPIVIVSYIISEKKSLDLGRVVFRAVTFGMIALEFIYHFYQSSVFYYIIVRRTMFLPAWLSGIYYDFFRKGSKIWFSQSAFLLESIIPDTYSSSPLQLINNYYFLGKMSSPNTGLFGEAYMQAGVLGVLLFPMIFYVVFKLIEITYRPFGKGIEFIVTALVSITITNQPILSRGAMFSVVFPTILIYFFSRQRSIHIKNL